MSDEGVLQVIETEDVEAAIREASEGPLPTALPVLPLRDLFTTLPMVAAATVAIFAMAGALLSTAAAAASFAGQLASALPVLLEFGKQLKKLIYHGAWRTKCLKGYETAKEREVLPEPSPRGSAPLGLQ